MIHPHPNTLEPETMELLGTIFLWFLIVWGSLMAALGVALWKIDPHGRRESWRYIAFSLFIVGLGLGAKMEWL